MQKIIFWNIFSIITILLIYFSYQIGFPFLIGIILSYIFLPFFKKINSIIKSKSISALIVTFMFLIFIIFLTAFIIPVIKEDLYFILKNIPIFLKEKLNSIDANSFKSYIPISYLKCIETESMQYLSQFSNLILNFVVEIFSPNGIIVNTITVLTISPFVIFFVLRDFDKIKSSISAWIPKSQRKNYLEFISAIDSTLSKYLTNYCKTIFVLSVYYIISLSLIGIKSSIMLGIFSGIMVIIPYIGCFLCFCFATIISIAQIGSLNYVEIFIVLIYGIGYFVEVYIMAPKIGKELGIHTLWIFFAFLAGIQLCGIFGLIISIPSAALINTTIKYFLTKFKKSRIYNDV